MNVDNKKDFHSIRYATTGEANPGSYSLTKLSAYISEIASYGQIYYYIEDSLIALLLWRGHHHITFRIPFSSKDVTISLPINSFIAFLQGIFIVERPRLIPCFAFASITWMMIGEVFVLVEKTNSSFFVQNPVRLNTNFTLPYSYWSKPDVLRWYCSGYELQERKSQPMA